MKCPLCSRDTEGEFCLYHAAAKEKVEAVYPLWVKAYGRITWKDYLDSVKRNPQTGLLAKEIEEFLRG